jgi:hypothetical protein
LDKGKVLGILLSLLSLCLVIVPVVAAFAAHGWDPKAALLGSSNPLETRFENLQNLNTQNMFGYIDPLSIRIDNMSFNDLITELQSLSLDELNTYKQSSHSLNATVPITSPLDFPIKIKNISGNLKCKDNNVVFASARLEGNEVSFSAHENKNLSIIGTTTQGGITYLVNRLLDGGGFPTNIGIEDVSLKLDIYGIVIEGAFGSV